VLSRLSYRVTVIASDLLTSDNNAEYDVAEIRQILDKVSGVKDTNQIEL
jgi:hypothetical protein